MTRILCFGDSITKGTEDPGGGWPLRLQNNLARIYIDERGVPLHPVYNLGVSADTSEDILSRIELEIEARVLSEAPITILNIGTNDSCLINGGPWVEGDKFATNLRKILGIAQDNSQAVLVLSLLPCQDELLNPAPWVSHDEYVYSTKSLRAYSTLAKKVCLDESVEFIEMFDMFGDLDLDKFFTDGLHPNSVGQQYIADKIHKRVAELANSYSG